MQEKKQLYVFEGMTSISALIKAAEESPKSARKIEKIIFEKSKARDKFRQVGFLKAKAESLGFVLQEAEKAQIDELASGKTHGGFIALCGERDIPKLTTDIIPENGIFYLIEGIEDPYNLGYTLRALYAAGADGVILPPRNWMSAAGVVARSSAGCSELINIFFDDPDLAAKKLKASGYRVICANIRDSKLIYDANLRAPVLFVIGGEKRGISRSVLELSDENIRIGYSRDFGGSLPTAEAAAIIAFEAAKINNIIKE